MAIRLFVGLCLLLHGSVLGLRVASGGGGGLAEVDERQELAAIDSGSSCPATLFAYFKSGQPHLFLALDSEAGNDGSHFTEVNDGKPIPLDIAAGTFIRDPFISRDKDGEYRLVATNGAGFGNTDTVLMWHSSDLQNWSKQNIVSVMQPHKDDLKNTWAPEWVHLESEAGKPKYLVFWATQWKEGKEHFDASCDNDAKDRFSFWGATTTDWNEFSEPQPILDPHCMKPQKGVGRGGIDGNMHYDKQSQMYYMFYKDSRLQANQELQKTSGIRMMATKTPLDPKSWTQPKWSQDGEMVGPWGTEGPELLVVGDQVRMYFDCAFQPKQADGSRPSFGKATAKLSEVFTAEGESTPPWQVVDGSCTAQGDKLKFPKEAVHGGFACIPSAKATEMVARKWQ